MKRPDTGVDFGFDGNRDLLAVLAAASRCTTRATQTPDRASLDAAIASVDRLSDALLAATLDIGLDDPTARRLMRSRSELDSHALASHVLDDPAIDPRVRLALLHRGVECVRRALTGTVELVEVG